MNNRPHKAGKEKKDTGPKRGDTQKSQKGSKKPPFPGKKN